MSLPEALSRLRGRWTGMNKLWLTPDDPVLVSDAAAEVGTAVGGRFLTIAYTWAEEGPQDGLIILGREEDGGTFQAIWVDSWHQGKFMLCQGRPDAAGRVAVQGKYPAPSGPDWGWEIAIEPDGRDSFRIVMDNITPGGERARAVEMSLARKR